MVHVTPIAGPTILLSIDAITAIEPSPHPVVLLADGRRLVVIDDPGDLARRILVHRATRLAGATVPHASTGEVVTPIDRFTGAAR